MAEQEIEYESDPEEAKLSLKMRRREASDEEEEEEEEGTSGVRDKQPSSLSQRIGDDSEDGESEGAAAEYYEDELDYDLDEDEYVEEDEEDVGGVEVVAVDRAVKDGGGGDVGELEEAKSKGVSDGKSEVRDQVSKSNVEDGRRNEEEGEKKVVEPYAVPTAGAFYMHDDRFRDNAGGRHRRMFGGRKLWESKDDRKWGHDKFEELRTQDRNYGERGRGSRGRHRGRGRKRGTERGHARNNRHSEFVSDSKQNNNNSNHAPKGVKGRVPQRYQASSKSNSEAPLSQNTQSGKSMEKPSSFSSDKTSESVSNAKSDAVVPRKQVFASNLNIASPPFYPSNSSTNENNAMDKKNVQGGPISRNGRQSSGDENFPTAKSTGMLRGKNIVDSTGVDKLCIDDSQSAMAGKPANHMQMPFSGSSSVNPTQQFRAQGRGTTSFAQMAYKPAVSNNQGHSLQGNAGKGRGQPSIQASSQQFSRRVSSGPQASSLPKASAAVNANEAGEVESPSEPSHLKNALVAQDKGRGTMPFLYGGPQVMGASGNTGNGHGNQNFPAFLPVMQFGGQHPGGMGVPAVGMAFPGYVGQPQLGRGNSEMTWLPVIAGAGGALGATFCPPYLSVDGSYHARPSGQTPSVTAPSSKENNTTNDGKPAQKTELSNDDFGQRQKNPRRYTEMKFDQ